jgi:hypothetical protein
MKKVLQKISLTTFGLLTPVLAFAQTEGATRGISNLLRQIQQILNMVVPILIGLGVVGFMWGIVLYLFGKNKEEGKTFMIWGIIALFVMTSVWGLVGILKGTLFPNDGSFDAQNVNIPQQ